MKTKVLMQVLSGITPEQNQRCIRLQQLGYSTNQIIDAIFGVGYIDKLSSSIPEEELRELGTQAGIIKPVEVQRNRSISETPKVSDWTGFRKE